MLCARQIVSTTTAGCVADSKASDKTNESNLIPRETKEKYKNPPKSEHDGDPSPLSPAFGRRTSQAFSTVVKQYLIHNYLHRHHLQVPQKPKLLYKPEQPPTMAPLTRRNSVLARKIATLQLHLAPLVPLPTGPPHPSFPKTLMAFHLMSEDELDSMAHYYHQSTPGQWTNMYPAPMNWDKDFLARPATTPTDPELQGLGTRTSPEEARRHSRRLSQAEVAFFADLMKTVEDLSNPAPVLASQGEGAEASLPKSYAGLSDVDRIRIKRRKVGKFIGLVGMETPVEEIAGRIQASIDRAVECGREDLRRNEEFMMGRRKMV